MKEAAVYIGIGKQIKGVNELFNYAITLNNEHSDFIISGNRVEEFKKDFISKKENFLEIIGQYYQRFKQENVTNIRYFLFSSLAEDIGTSIPLEVTRAIRDFHKEVTIMTCEIEAFFLLPSLDAIKSQKAQCYSFLMELNNDYSLFDFIWLIDANRLPQLALKDTISSYLSTNAYRSFNSLSKTAILNEKFLDMPISYSTLGIFKLLFPAEKWQKFLSLKLGKDILSLSRLSPFEPTKKMVEMAVSSYRYFFERTRLPKMVNIIKSCTALSGKEEPLAGLMEEEEEIEKIIERFFAKLDLLTIQEEEKLWEEGGLKEECENFTEEVREEAERIMDEESHGPFSSLGFITLLLDTQGPYTTLLRELEEKGEKVSFSINLSGYLFGWSGEKPSVILKIIFNEIGEELRQIYSTYFLPFPELVTWHALLRELNRIINLPNFNILLGKDTGRVLKLKESAEIVINGYEKRYTSPLTSRKVIYILNVIEEPGKKRLKELLEEVRSIEKKFVEINGKIKSLGWRKYLPNKWGLFLDRKDIRKAREEVRSRLRKQGESVIEKRQRLLPCYASIFVYERLKEKLLFLENKVRGFTDALIAELQRLKREMEEITFEKDPITWQIAEKEEKDISSLYYKEFSSQDIPKIFEDEFFKFIKLPPRISQFYHDKEREQFFINLHTFCLYKFNWLLDLNAEKVMFHLKKVEDALYTLQSSCRPFVTFKEYPEEKVKSCLYVGLEDETRTKLSDPQYSQCLRGSYQFYNTGNPWEIPGLRIVHGFPLFAIEGWEHWKRCCEEEKQ